MSNIISPSNIYGTTIRDDVFVGPFVEIQKNCTIGSKTRISSHSFVCENVDIGENCFIAHGVMFTNDKFKEKTANIRPKEYSKTTVGNNVRIGSNATILPVTIGNDAIIGAGSVVTHDVEAGSVVAGNPARPLQTKKEESNSIIRLTDVRKVNQEFESDYFRVLSNVLMSGRYSLGNETLLMEQTLQRLLGLEFVIGVSSGTAALELAFHELHLTSEDEFIVQSNAFIASVTPIASSGCQIVLTDVNQDGSININDVKKLITTRTKGVLVVHLYGDVVVDMFAMRLLCDKHKLMLIEDCAQSLGSKLGSRMIGSFGDISCFSFYPTKNVGALGEAGAIGTNNKNFNINMRKRRHIGCAVRYEYDLLGTNARLDELQAGFINCKLAKLEEIIQKKHILANMYEEFLSHSNLLKRLIIKSADIHHSYHLMVYIVKECLRDKLVSFLHENNIEALVHYPIPFHKSKAMEKIKMQGNGKMSEFLAKNIISLPMYHTLATKDVEYICGKIMQFEKEIKISPTQN